MKKALNVKQMKDTIINYSIGDNKEFGKIWDTFLMMANMGFISQEEWGKFSDEFGTLEWVDNSLVDRYSGKVIAYINLYNGLIERA